MKITLSTVKFRAHYFALRLRWKLFDIKFWFKYCLSQYCKYYYQRLYLSRYKTNYYSKDKIWDGMTRNNFKQGRFMQTLIKLKVIGKHHSDYEYYGPGDSDE